MATAGSGSVCKIVMYDAEIVAANVGGTVRQVRAHDVNVRTRHIGMQPCRTSPAASERTTAAPGTTAASPSRMPSTAGMAACRFCRQRDTRYAAKQQSGSRERDGSFPICNVAGEPMH